MTEHTNNQCKFARDKWYCETLYSLYVSREWWERRHQQWKFEWVYREHDTRKKDGRHVVSFPRTFGKRPLEMNEQHSRKRLHYVNRKLAKNPEPKRENNCMINEQWNQEVMKVAPEYIAPGIALSFCYMWHKPVVRHNATTTKVRSEKGRVDRCKAQLVAQGYSERNWLQTIFCFVLGIYIDDIIMVFNGIEIPKAEKQCSKRWAVTVCNQLDCHSLFHYFL